MTISVRGIATGLTGSNDTATPFLNMTYTIPTGEQTGDLIFGMCGAKWSTASQYSSALGVPATYNLVDWVAEGTTVTGNGTGSAYLQVIQKTATSGAEADPAQVFTVGYSPAMTAMITFQKTNPGIWTVESTDAIDTNTASPFSLTGAATLGFTTGDYIMLVTAHNDDVTAEVLTSLTVTGCVVGTVTERLQTNATNSGNDGSMWCYTAEILSGTATAAPQASINTAATEGNGVAIFVRIIEPPRTSDEYWGMLPF